MCNLIARRAAAAQFHVIFRKPSIPYKQKHFPVYNLRILSNAKIFLDNLFVSSDKSTLNSKQRQTQVIMHFYFKRLSMTISEQRSTPKQYRSKYIYIFFTCSQMEFLHKQKIGHLIIIHYFRTKLFNSISSIFSSPSQ